MNPNLKPAKFIRKANNIRNVETDTNEHFETCNLAKKASRKLQARLGDGTVRKAI
jgi:hypothetical protein